MTQSEKSTRPHLQGLLAGLFLAGGLICAASLVTGAWLKIAESQTISVTGSARRNVVSDLIVWRGSVSVEGATLAAAQGKLKEDTRKVHQFLQDRGATNSLAASIVIQEIRARQKSEDEVIRETTTGYRLTQSFEIRSAEVGRISQLNRESMTLVEDGVLFTANPPEYIYTKAGEAKVEMLAEATRDARARADQIASQGGRGIAQLRSARMGVFQITPVYSIQTAWDGMNDTTSLEKTITAVISASFSMN